MACDAQRTEVKRKLLTRAQALSVEKAALAKWEALANAGDEGAGAAFEAWLFTLRELNTANAELKAAGKALLTCWESQR